ncbi:MAG TPA: hypothetical protein PKD91_09720 [Bacteroidia bacterium]|nr:hypothetical protein [Bacteroidia bacterium]
MTIDEIKEKLASKKSADRLRATKEIIKEKIVELSDELFATYLKERQDPRTWEPQSEMIKALGLLDHKPALEYIEEIVRKNIPHDMITINASVAFVQLKRNSIFDAQPILDLLSFGSTSVICGALEVLAIDKMLPPNNEIEEIIKICWDINKHKDRIGHEFGLTDPRKYLAIACAGWDKTLCAGFLNHCIETAYNINRFDKPVENTNLIDICKNSLKGKYTKF